MKLLCLLVPSLVFTSVLAAGENRPVLQDPGPPPKEMHGLPLLHFDDFESEAAAEKWQPTDSEAWTVTEQPNGNHVYSLVKKKSDFSPPHRSPLNRALLKGVVVGDFVLDVYLQSTEPDYPHRSLCLFFGYQDDSHLYYVHFGKRTDDHANQIFIVNDAPRSKISTKTTPGTNWDDEWRHARIVRNVESGTIEVYFDDMQTPVMTATDKTFKHGRVGIGAFDDRGNFDHVALYGRKVEQ
ncbi:MAG: hypothetical protein ACREJB_01170 [Planctomycetaceae bacterium]